MYLIGLIFTLSLYDSLEVATTLYTTGDYELAITKYEYLLESGIYNYAVYYNLGNCYFKLGELGKTIFFYRKAQKLRPFDLDINFNLNFARSKRVDEVKSTELPKLVKLIINLLTYPNINSLAVVSSILYFGVIFIACLSILGKVLPVAQISAKWKIGVTVGFVIVLSIFCINLERINRNEGVLLAKVAEVRSAPSEDYTLIFTIHEGMEVRILGERSGWVEIRLPDGLSGWVKGDQIGRI